MSQGDIEDIIIDATNDETSYIPADIYEYYLFNYRGSKDDIEFLDSGAGLSFLFGIDDRSERYQYLEYFISKGASLDKPSSIDGYPPLHAAIINNDAELVAFLLSKGASPDQRDKQHNLTAKEFANYLGHANPDVDRNMVLNVLSGHSK